MSDLRTYRQSDREAARTADLLRILPRGRRSVLDVGARDGHFTRLLTDFFPEVTGLDLEKPQFEFPNVTTIAGDATKLSFGSDSFDCVFCAEVLEHISDLERACRELIRVAKYEIVVGVPFRQDTRIERSTCRSCGKPNPPWGHVNSFDEARLDVLFQGARAVSRSFVGEVKEATNPLSTLLMDLAGNPWGCYEQDEPCVYCGTSLAPPAEQVQWQRICSGLATRLNRWQTYFTRAHANWIHVVFSKIP